MSEEERNGCGSGGGGAKRTCFTYAGRVVTDKRRRRCVLSSGSVPQGEACTSSGDQVHVPKAVVLPHVLYDGVHEMGGFTRIEQCWKAILEETLLSQDVNNDGICSCIQKALASGHLGLTGIFNAHAAQAKYTHEGNGNLHSKAEGVNTFFNAAKKQEVTFGDLQRETSEQAEVCVITKKCQNVLLEVLMSEKFAFLCNLLLGNFPGIKASSIVDFSRINSRIKNMNGHSIGHFHQDLQQVWERIQKIGQEMVLLATGLSNISQAACQKQIIVLELLHTHDRRMGEALREALRVGVDEEHQKPNGFVIEENSNDSHTTAQFPYESEPSTKPEQPEVSCLYKVSICKQCGIKANGKCSLICDGCEATYHFSCVKPAVQGIPTQSWYCSACTRDRKESAEPDITYTNQDSPHQNCVVCDRLKVLGMREQQTRDDGDNVMTANNSRVLGMREQQTQDDGDNVMTANNSRERSVSGMDSEGPPQPASTASSHLCKICGTCEDDERKFIICGHKFCLYKYYHIRCLETSQVASQQQHHGCWYCPSCLCRACLVDKDDHMIVMCDGCDKAYHTYCMKPPRTLVPEGQWYCIPCNISRAKEGMRRYEQWVLQQHGQSDGKTSGTGRSMDTVS